MRLPCPHLPWKSVETHRRKPKPTLITTKKKTEEILLWLVFSRMAPPGQGVKFRLPLGRQVEGPGKAEPLVSHRPKKVQAAAPLHSLSGPAPPPLRGLTSPGPSRAEAAGRRGYLQPHDSTTISHTACRPRYCPRRCTRCWDGSQFGGNAAAGRGGAGVHGVHQRLDDGVVGGLQVRAAAGSRTRPRSGRPRTPGAR